MRFNTSLRPSGYGTVSQPDDKNIEFDFLQCVHCGRQFIRPDHAKEALEKSLTALEAMFYESEGKRVIGFCHNCNGPICSARCMVCVPAEKMLGIAEGTVDPTAVSVSGAGLVLPPDMS